MRAMFGLTGVLIVVGVIVWWMGAGGGLEQTHQTLKTGEAVRGEVSQMAGHDPATGGKASDSVSYDVLINGGKPTGVLVTKIVSGGAYEKYFGLLRNDTIVAVEYQGLRQNVRDMGDSEMAKAQIAETFQKRGAVYVMRDGGELKLPAAAAVKPEAPGTPPAENKSSLQRQLDAITTPR